MDMIELGRRDLHPDYLVYVSYIYTFVIESIMLTGCNPRQCVTIVPSTPPRHLPIKIKPQQSLCFHDVLDSLSQVDVTAQSRSPR